MITELPEPIGPHQYKLFDFLNMLVFASCTYDVSNSNAHSLPSLFSSSHTVAHFSLNLFLPLGFSILPSISYLRFLHNDFLSISKFTRL